MKGNLTRREREVPPLPATFLSETTAAISKRSGSVHFPLPLSFLQLRFANSSLICRKPIVTSLLPSPRGPESCFKTGECASPAVVE